MQSVRSSLEYPKGGGPQGTTRFDAAIMRPVVVKDGQATQIVDLGNVTAVTTTYTVLATDGVVELGNTTSYTVTLPARSAVPKGWSVIFKQTGASGLKTIARAGSDTIDGATSVTLSKQYETVQIMNDGSNWVKVAAFPYLLKQVVTGAATVADATDICVITSDTAFALTLPAAATKAGKIIFFKKNAGAGTNACTITRAGSDTIDGATTYTLTLDKRVVALYSDGSAWFILIPSGLAMTAG